eukprot:gene16544-18873_t
MIRGGLDPRQVAFQGYEARCTKLAKELQAMPGAKYVAKDSGFASVPNYADSIPHPISLEGVLNRIQGKGSGDVKKYTYLNDFALEVRRVFGNFIRYNWLAHPETVKLRKEALKVLFKFEQFWYELHQEVEMVTPGMYFKQPLPELKWGLQAFDDVVKVKVGEKYLIDDFIYHIQYYFPDPADIKKYKAIVKRPMSFGELMSNLVEGSYDSLDDLKDDLDAIVNNCSTYWSRDGLQAGGEALIKNAMALQTAFLKSLNSSEHEVSTRGKGAAALSLMPRVTKATPVTAAVAAPSASTGKAGSKGKSTASNASAASTVSAAPAPTITLKLKRQPSAEHSASSVVATESAPAISVPVPTTAAAIAALDRKIDKYLRTAFKVSLDAMKNHYLVGNNNGQSFNVYTARPFLRAVDPLAFPDYATIITDPIDINKIEKRLNTDRYGCLSSSGGSAELAVSAILKDLTLLRDNAHTYNTGAENVEVRIMADCLLHYFKYVLKECLVYLKTQHTCKDAMAMAQAIFSPSATSIAALLKESTPQDVKTYISVSSMGAERVITESELPKLLGITPAASSHNNAHSGVNSGGAGASATAGSVTLTLPKKAAPVSAVAAAPVVTAVASAPIAKKKSFASPQPKAHAAPVAEYMYEADEYDDPDYAEYTPTTTAKGAKRNSHAPPAGVAAGASLDAHYGGVYEQGELISTREKAAWELAAEEVWKHIRRHAYVDPAKPTMIWNYFHPVIALDPSIAPAYLALISQPMDLTTLITELNAGNLEGPQHFLDLALTIFQNSIDYNAGHQADSSYAVHLVQRCEVLKKFINWMALETLPVQDDRTHPKPESLGYLRTSVQLAERKVRDDILSNWFISDTGNSPYTECNKLLKDLQRGRTNAERVQIGFFQIPVNETAVSDYSVYVRNPADLSTIKYRLDGSLPSNLSVANVIDKTAKRYLKYGEFVADLRRVFTNAIKYNGAHLTSDSTGITQQVYEAALMLQERLESLLAPFTVHLADRIERARVTNAELQEQMSIAKAKRDAEEAEAKKFEQLVLAELKATDEVFAADYDLEQKSKLTELQLKAHILAQQRAMLNANSAVSGATMEDLGRDMAADDTSTGGQMSPLTAAASGALFGAGMHLNGNMLGLAVAPLPGFGILGKVPSRFAHLVELKKSVRDKAWAHWMAAPGLVTHNASHKSKQSASSSGNNNSSGNNGASKSKIRLTAGTGGNAGG